MPDPTDSTPVDVETDPKRDAAPERPELSFDPGEIAPCWASPYPDADLDDKEEKALKSLCDTIGNVDVAARRCEVEEAWQSRLYDRGFQYLLPRRNGGWVIPFATSYTWPGGRRERSVLDGNETNIYATYGEIISAALTRDIPGVRWFPQSPSSDADITAADAASRYAKVFARSNDLLDFQHQLAYYMRTDGRVLIVTDHIVDAQQFGRCDPEAPSPVVPETESQSPEPFLYLIRHGETEMNRDGKMRGQTDVPLDTKGEREMDRAGDWLKDKGIKAIISSPVERALSSAQLIAEKLGVPLEVDDRLASVDVGSLAGEESDEEVEEAFEHRDEPIAGGESPDEFASRVQAAVMDALSNPNKPCALLVHDSVISQVFKMFQGEAVPPGSNTEPGWIAALTPNEDGTFKPGVVYPVNPPETSVGEQRGRPCGQEVVRCYGKLEHKVPFNAPSGKIEDCLWAQLSLEYDVSAGKSMFPEKADKIKAGGSVAGENELDRIARINANLALEANYVTGDSMVRDVTIQRTWMRPGYFMNVDDMETRRSLFEKFPDGVLCIQVSDTFVKARNENMDDHLTLLHAFPGSGMNRMALCSKLLSVQKRVNNWIDLLDQYFIRCIAQRYMAEGPFNVQAMRNAPQPVGGITPFQLDQIPPNRSLTDAIFLEPTPTHQPSMPDFIKFFLNELPQMISHALPSLFGAIANTDMSGVAMSIQRDQALGCLGTPWHSIQMATSRYFRQAVQLAARCRPAYGQNAVEGSVDGKAVRVELGELKGNVLAYPESDANFPESWVQKQSRWMTMLQDAANPFMAKLMGAVQNRMAALEAIALEGVKDPDADSWEKQMGEFEILLKSGPVPNPALVQPQQMLAEATERIQGLQRMGNPANPQDIQALGQLQKQVDAIPPFISSVPIKDTDNHEVEAECCLEKINCPEGRKFGSGTPDEQKSFENLTLHYQEHKAKVEPKPTMVGLPKGVSLNLKDAPPDAMANALKDTGLETSGQDVVQTREFNAELRKTSRVGGGPVPGAVQ